MRVLVAACCVALSALAAAPASGESLFESALQNPPPPPGPALNAYVRDLTMKLIMGGHGPGPSYATATESPRAEDPRLLPDDRLTPGKIAEHSAAVVCRRGYSGSARHTSVELKRLIDREYGVTNFGDVELDHRVPVKLGGADDAANIWAQPRYGSEWNADRKDHLEWRLITYVCDGEPDGADQRLAEAQVAMMGNWMEAYAKYCPEDSMCPGYGRGDD